MSNKEPFNIFFLMDYRCRQLESFLQGVEEEKENKPWFYNRITREAPESFCCISIILVGGIYLTACCAGLTTAAIFALIQCPVLTLSVAVISILGMSIGILLGLLIFLVTIAWCCGLSFDTRRGLKRFDDKLLSSFPVSQLSFRENIQNNQNRLIENREEDKKEISLSEALAIDLSLPDINPNTSTLAEACAAVKTQKKLLQSKLGFFTHSPKPSINQVVLLPRGFCRKPA